mmetsp:Transcript_22428/g.62573  ORF Transcript_22428/g.62573 Transcript_22428/m.62573 type:complete len:134 (-) Transcript_22428:192-593(-)
MCRNIRTRKNQLAAPKQTKKQPTTKEEHTIIIQERRRNPFATSINACGDANVNARPFLSSRRKQPFASLGARGGKLYVMRSITDAMLQNGGHVKLNPAAFGMCSEHFHRTIPIPDEQEGDNGPTHHTIQIHTK